MGSFIPEEVIEAIRHRLDIVEFISEFVRLEKKGNNFTGNCPFHQDKDPSFTVSKEKQIFYCFGCNVGGNIFKFLMLRDSLDFPGAVRVLAEKAGIRIPESEDPVQRERDRKHSRLKDINAEAVIFFQRCLQEGRGAEQAREYLARRGINPEVREMFQLGYAPDGWDVLTKHLKNRGYTARELVDAGLATTGDRGEYDRFRRRIVFPIRDEGGRVVGFGGRVLDSSLPKYLNTPETSIFSKGRLLYGLDLARRGILARGFTVVMEGYLDVITAHRCGVDNAVASLGTSLTREQGRLLLRLTKNVVIAYDADAAGVAATVRGLDLLQETGCRVQVVNIPPGQDPDDYLREHGLAGWEKLLGRAESLLAFKMRQAGLRQDIVAGGKTAMLGFVLPNMAWITDEVERVEAIQLVASRLQTTWDAVAGELRRFLEKERKNWVNPDKNVKTMHNIFVNRDKSYPRFMAEKGLLRLVLEEPGLAREIQQELGLGFFKNPGCDRIFKVLLNNIEQPQQYRLDTLYDQLDEQDQQLLTTVVTQNIPGENPVQILNGYVDSFKKFKKKENREQLLGQLAEAENAGDWNRVYQLQRLLQQTY